jgi:cytochrome c6
VLAAVHADFASFDTQRFVEGNGLDVLDCHLFGKSDDMAQLVDLAHGVVEDSGYNAAVAVSGRTGVTLAETELTDEAVPFLGEFEAHAFGIVVSAGEAEVFLEGEGFCGMAATRVFGYISGHVGCIVLDSLRGIAGRSFIIEVGSKVVPQAAGVAQPDSRFLWACGPSERHRFFDYLIVEKNVNAKSVVIGHWAVVFCGLMLLVVACMPFAAQGNGKTSAGAATFKAKCVLCHGADGAGNTPLGKQLQAANLRSKEAQKLSDQEMHKIIHDGQANMPPFGEQLTDDEVDQVIQYGRTFTTAAKMTKKQ